MPAVSVILCTHNPRIDYFCRAIEGIRAQSIGGDGMEVVVVDNASRLPSPALDVCRDVPGFRLVREDQVGLVHARRRGLSETRSDLVVFVDDDNVLATGYLACAIEIAGSHPTLGVWGGQCLPEFEGPAPDWTRRYWGYLAIREFDRDRWGNTGALQLIPVGAGMCVRRVVTDQYVASLDRDARRLRLGRSGTRLFGGEDLDMALTACDMGLGTGVFRRLTLTHLIPKARLDEGYLARLLEDLHYSSTLRDAFRGITPRRRGRLDRLTEAIGLLRMPARDRRLHRAMSTGRRQAAAALARNIESPSW